MLFEHLNKVTVRDDQIPDEVCIALLCAHFQRLTASGGLAPIQVAPSLQDYLRCFV